MLRLQPKTTGLRATVFGVPLEAQVRHLFSNNDTTYQTNHCVFRFFQDEVQCHQSCTTTANLIRYDNLWILAMHRSVDDLCV